MNKELEEIIVENLTGQKVFNLVAVNRDLIDGVVKVYIELFTTEEKAQEALKSEYEDMKGWLKEVEQELLVDDFGYCGETLYSGTLKTDRNLYNWEIRENTID